MTSRAPQGSAAPPTHELKTWPMYFEAIVRGDKTFEFRKDDREPRFAGGDVLRLREFDGEYFGSGEYSGRECLCRVSYIARGGLIPVGFCVMSVVPLESAASLVETPAQAPTTTETTETAWLVESHSKGEVRWWTGEFAPMHGFDAFESMEPVMSDDASKALRFARRDDAERAIQQTIPFIWRLALHASEHMWCPRECVGSSGGGQGGEATAPAKIDADSQTVLRMISKIVTMTAEREYTSVPLADLRAFARAWTALCQEVVDRESELSTARAALEERTRERDWAERQLADMFPGSKIAERVAARGGSGVETPPNGDAK